MLSILDPLRELTLLSIALRLLIAALCGGLIGVERGRKRHAAGLRTHAVVCVGAACVMMVNQYITLMFQPDGDPARMGAQVISGIGFLGAGTIIITGRQQGQRVKGLTTAAGLWASACMGLAVGIGFYEGAFLMFLLLMLVIAALNHLDETYIKSPSSVQLYLELQSDLPLSTVLEPLCEQGWRMTSLLQQEERAGRTAVLLDIQQKGRNQSTDQLLSCVRSVDGVLWADQLFDTT